MLCCYKKNLDHQGAFRVGFVELFKLERSGSPVERVCWFSSQYLLSCAGWGVCLLNEPGEQIWLKNYQQNQVLKKLFCLSFSDVHIVSTLEPLSNAVKRNVPRCTITLVLLEQAHFRISVTCPSFVQTILIRLLKDVSTQYSNGTISTRFYESGSVVGLA